MAGLIDGDGWFTMYNPAKIRKNSIVNSYAFGIEQRYRPIIEYFLEFGGNFTTRHIKDKEHHRQTYEWKITTKNMLSLLENIEPFLIEKRNVCKNFIDYIQKCNDLERLSKELLIKRDNNWN